MASLRKQLTFDNTITGFPTKWHLKNERSAEIPYWCHATCHYPDLDSTSDWTRRVGNLIQPIRSTTKIWVVMRHQYGISAFVFDFSDIIWQGNQWWGRQMLAVFSGYWIAKCNSLFLRSALKTNTEMSHPLFVLMQL